MSIYGDEIVAAYLAGDSLRLISEQFGGAPVTWWRYLRSKGVTLRPRGTGTDESRARNAEIVRLYGEGVKQAEIARRLEMRPQAVWKVIRNETRRI